MIDKTNITIENKDTKKISYRLNLEGGYWYKQEFDSRGNETYFEDNEGYWHKSEFNAEGNVIYYESSRGVIKDKR
jgi:hypothetical protein